MILLILLISILQLFSWQNVKAKFTKNESFISKYSKFIEDYLDFKQLRYVIFGLCDLNDRREAVKIFAGKGFLSNAITEVKFESDSLIRGNYNDSHVAFILEINCDLSQDIIFTASAMNLFTLKQHWLMLEIKKKYAPEFEKVNINVDSDILLAIDGNGGISLVDIYSTGFEKGGKLVANSIGNWSLRWGFDIKASYRLEMRSNLGGIVLTSSIVVVQKLKATTFKDYVMDDQNHSYDILSKSSFATVYNLAQMFNFSLRVIRTTSWGYAKNGSFDGQAGLMQRKVVDIGGTGLYIKKDRMEIVEPIGQCSYQRVVIIFRQPKRTGSSVLTFVRPLSWDVWQYTLGCIIAIATMFIISYKAELTLLDASILRSYISDILIVIIATISQQGIAEVGRLSSTRIIVLSSLLFSLLLYQFYSASIVSSLLMEPAKSIKTPEDLLASNLKLLIEDIVYHKIYFENSKSNVAKKIYSEKGFNGTSKYIFKPAKEGIAMVREGGYAFYFDTNNGYKMIQDTYSMREICDLGEVYFSKKNVLATMVTKKSHFRELFAFGLRKMHERGVLNHEMNRWHLKRPSCVVQLSSSTFSVGIEEIASAFVLHAIGVMVAFLILLMEISLGMIRDI